MFWRMLRDEDAAERVLRAQAEHEVGEVVEVVGRRAGRPRELAGVGVAAVERVDVLHFDVDLLELVAGLERLAPHQPRVVHLRIPHRRVLPLRVRRLAAEIRIAGDALRRQAAGDARIGRQPGRCRSVERARDPSAGGFLPPCVVDQPKRTSSSDRSARRSRSRRARAACCARRCCRCRRRPTAAECGGSS